MKTLASLSTVGVLIAVFLVMDTGRAFGLGSDYRNDQPVGGTGSWPKGVKELVNTTNRVHGFFVNAEDIFFFAGTATNFADFLRDYSKIQSIEQHRVVLHEGVGEAKSPWDKSGRPCDWKLYACPRSWLNLGKASPETNSLEAMRQSAKDTNFVLEVHFWTGGKIAWDQITVPKNVEFGGECLKNFESITNGMARAEVEKRLTMDGGLQSVSPVRYIDPGCPGFKISVEFDFKKDTTDQNRAIQAGDDKVIRVSKPYLERPFAD